MLHFEYGEFFRFDIRTFKTIKCLNKRNSFLKQILINEKHVFITITTKISVDHQISSTIILFVPNKNAIMKFVNFPITNFSSCTIQIVTKLNSVSFIQIILKNVIIKVFVLLHIHKAKSSKILSLSIYLKKTLTFTFTSIKLFGVHLLKSTFLN